MKHREILRKAIALLEEKSGFIVTLLEDSEIYAARHAETETHFSEKAR